MLDRIRRARKAEKDAKADWQARWKYSEGVPYRVEIAQAIAEALEEGHRKKAVLEALGTSNYATVHDYLAELEDTPEPLVAAVSATRVETSEAPDIQVSGSEATVGAHKYQRDDKGHWEPVDPDDDAAWKMMMWLPK